MDELVRFAPTMSLDGQRKCLKEQGKIRERNDQGFHRIFFHPSALENHKHEKGVFSV